MKVCLYYQPEAYSTAGEKLMGRNAAGEGFLSAYSRYFHTSEHWVLTDNLEKARQLQMRLQENGRNEPLKWLPLGRLPTDADLPMSIFFPGPGLARHAWHRQVMQSQRLALTGITHTTASDIAMDAIVALVSAPVRSSDALICTSSAVKEHVEKILAAEIDYIRARHGSVRETLPMLPIIPLGTHVAELEDYRRPEAMLTARKELGIDPSEIVILYVGRLSFHAKANPLPMYTALAETQRVTGKRIVLIECGWFANEPIEAAYRAAWEKLCGGLRRITLDGRKQKSKAYAWGAADIFCSLADNIQETFGLTPIEAMAAGVPVVVSDWNGYKDTVQHGKQGFRIKTLCPPNGFGQDLANDFSLGVMNYDRYCGYTSTSVIVDIPQAIDAFIQLVNDRALRLRLGEAGSERAKKSYDWKVIMDQYVELWAQQAEAIKTEAPITQLGKKNPSRLDPFLAFSHYASEQIDLDEILILSQKDAAAAEAQFKSLQQLEMVKFPHQLFVKEQEINTLIHAVGAKQLTIRQALEQQTQQMQLATYRTIIWLIKLGVFRSTNSLR